MQRTIEFSYFVNSIYVTKFGVSAIYVKSFLNTFQWLNWMLRIFKENENNGPNRPSLYKKKTAKIFKIYFTLLIWNHRLVTFLIKYGKRYRKGGWKICFLHIPCYLYFPKAGLRSIKSKAASSKTIHKYKENQIVMWSR